jgi:hypothetical protein
LLSSSGSPDFSWHNKAQRGKYTKYVPNYKIPKSHKNAPNGLQIYQMVIKFTNIFHCKALQKFTQIGIFGLEIYHLATLIQLVSSFVL